MTEVSFHPLVVTPTKRSFDSYIEATTGFESPLPTIQYDMPATQPSSPAPSTLSSLTDMSALASEVNAKSSSEPPTKKRKLTFLEKEAEKAAKQREKDEKQRLKAEDKARKEEEKARKDEERARKDEEKHKIAEEREHAKREKDMEKAKKQKEKEQREAEKEAERLKKEKSQLRLANFFVKPASALSPQPSMTDDVSEGVPSRRSSAASIHLDLSSIRPQLTSTNSEYGKWFLPFFVPDHTTLAPLNRFKPEGYVDHDSLIIENNHAEPLSKHFSASRRRQSRKLLPVKQLLNQAQELGNLDVIDLAVQETLDTYSFKILQFHEDVRPPYQGTITQLSPKSSRKLATNPTGREVSDLNYDYDSEAEWEPPGEDDEELNDEDEMSVADENEEEMADFLDDADDVARKKGPIADMQPVSSGLCWHDATYDDHGLNLSQYRMDVLHDSTKLPIDPFSSHHWADTEKSSPAKPKVEPTTVLMQPPRHPLATLTANAIPTIKKELGIDGKPIPSLTVKVSESTNKPVKLVDPEFMPAFKAAVAGSDLTKAGLIEILKKQFPKCSKDAIKDTLGAIAMRVGKKEVDKKWVLVSQD